jgi:hypothetical protein
VEDIGAAGGGDLVAAVDRVGDARVGVAREGEGVVRSGHAGDLARRIEREAQGQVARCAVEIVRQLGQP